MQELAEDYESYVEGTGVFKIAKEGTVAFKGTSCSIQTGGRELWVLRDGEYAVLKDYMCYPVEGKFTYKVNIGS